MQNQIMEHGSAKKVLVISASVGAGHNQAARAIVQGLCAARPQWQITQIDSLDFTSKLFRTYYNGGFILGMTRFPRIYGMGFALTNFPSSPNRNPGEWPKLIMERVAMRKFAAWVEKDPPDLIIHTHFLAPLVVSRMIRHGKVNIPQMVVVTDIYPHRWWYCNNIDRWFLAADESIDTLVRWGIARSDITVSGMPLLEKWSQTLDRAKVLADWKLPVDKKIVLLSGGTEFTCGPVVEIANGILEKSPNSAVVVLAGRNKELLEKLSACPLAGTRLFPQSFTDRGHELVEVASVFATKPGGITTAECLSRGTPMVLLNPVAGQEGDNAKFMARNGAAIIARGKREIIDSVVSLLGDDGKLAAMATAARSLYRPGTRTIVDAAAGWFD